MFSRGKRNQMKLKDKLIEEEREKERKIESETTQDISPMNTINHFSHTHPLVYTATDYTTFYCNCCAQRGRGMRYHCAKCKYDLHAICAQTPITWLLHHKTLEEIKTCGVPWENITTFAHPNHELVTEYKRQAYKCDHCKNPGNGLRFRCDPCDVMLHNVCATNPTRLTTYLHPEHELELKLRPYFKKCDLCGSNGPTNNRMYKCSKCDFYVHPECTQWPLYLAHPIHPPHPLVLKPCGDKFYFCSACMGYARGYMYGCKFCGLYFDLFCIFKQSKYGLGDEIRKKYTDDNQTMNVLPVTNLILPDISQIRHQIPANSGGSAGLPKGLPSLVQNIADLASSS